MLRDVVTLDAGMTAEDALMRLAANGYWTDPDQPFARAWLERYAERIRTVAARQPLLVHDDYPAYDDYPGGDTMVAEPRLRFEPASLTVEDAAQLLARPLELARVAIRRQDGVTIFWYARPVEVVLRDLEAASPWTYVLDALNLHEYSADPTVQESTLDEAGVERFSGVVLRGQEPVAVGDPRVAAGNGGSRRHRGGLLPTAPGEEGEGLTDVEVRAYPFLEAPGKVAVGKQFDLVISLSDTAATDVQSTGQLVLHASPGVDEIPLEVHVIASGFEPVGLWRRPLPVPVADPTKARITIQLTAGPQDELVRLTSLIVEFILDGVVRGTASRHIIVERSPGDAAPPDDRGQSWLGAESPPPNLNFAPITAQPDIEVDIAKPDRNAAVGSYQCVIRNAHGIPVPDKSLPIDLEDDAKTFAKGLIDDLRVWSKSPLVDNLMVGLGTAVAEKLPPEFWRILEAVGEKVTNRPVTLQLNSAEPYVPWELALVAQPLDPVRPKYLAAQVVMGRWILGDATVACPPRTEVPVRSMATMAGMYKPSSGLQPLPRAQEEAEELALAYQAMPAIELDCTDANLKLLLDATLPGTGGVDAVHFAGHGEVDPSRPGEAAIYLSSGLPLTPVFFKGSTLGKNYAPFIFLNACMVGTGGELLGAYGGFPGSCLSGGFSALVAPLWAVKDDVAKSFALDFYSRALVKGGGQPVAEVLRDLRSGYKPDQPVPSYLAYVYYGNPYLMLSHQ